jgi:Flp pilus assembly protein TadG
MSRNSIINYRWYRRGRGESGQALVEFALVLPLLALIILAIVQFGIAYNHYITLTDATRAGARKATVSRGAASPVADTEAAVRASGANLDQSKLKVTVTPNAPWTAGNSVTVAATYPYSINLFGLVVKSGNLSSTTTERVE